MSDHTITVDESQRQVLLMALAHLAVERPGWHPACIKPIAELMDDPNDSMYEKFRELHNANPGAEDVLPESVVLITAKKLRELEQAVSDANYD